MIPRPKALPALAPALRRAACALALAGLWACAGSRALEPGGAGRGPAAGLFTARAELRPVEDVFVMTGELSAVRSRDLTVPRTAAWRQQIRWLIEDGTTVRAGDRVVELDNSAVAATLEEKRLREIEAGISMESRDAALEAERETRRFAVEHAAREAEKARLDAGVPKELMARRDWQAAQTTLQRAEAALAKATLDLEAFEVSARSEQEMLRITYEKVVRERESSEREVDLLALKAPEDGIAIIGENPREERKFDVGDLCWPGSVVATIPELSTMEVVAWLSTVDDGRIAPGLPVRAILDTWPDRVFFGRVAEVAAIADARGFRTRIALDSSDPAIMRPGMSARVEVVRKTWDRALAVPRAAVAITAEGTFIRRAGEAAPVKVEIEACTPVECVVAAGLSEGDDVAIP